MLFMQTIKDDVELHSYHIHYGALKRQTYYVIKSNKITSFAHGPDMQIRYIHVKSTDNILRDELSYLKTIPVNQLKMMLAIKPDLLIEDLLDEEDRLFECPQSYPNT